MTTPKLNPGRTSYKRHRNCERISVGEYPICCPAFTFDLPKSNYREFSEREPVFLMRARESLDIDLDGVHQRFADRRKTCHFQADSREEISYWTFSAALQSGSQMLAKHVVKG